MSLESYKEPPPKQYSDNKRPVHPLWDQIILNGAVRQHRLNPGWTISGNISARLPLNKAYEAGMTEEQQQETHFLNAEVWRLSLCFQVRGPLASVSPVPLRSLNPTHHASVLWVTLCWQKSPSVPVSHAWRRSFSSFTQTLTCHRSWNPLRAGLLSVYSSSKRLWFEWATCIHPLSSPMQRLGLTG